MGCKRPNEGSIGFYYLEQVQSFYLTVTEFINAFDQLIGLKHVKAKVQNNIIATFKLKTKYLSIEKLVP